MPTARSTAHDVLDRVFFDDAYSHIALSNALDNSELSDRDQGLITELVYGVLARKRTLDAVLSNFVNRSLDGLDNPVLISLRMAAYQLIFLDRIPDHAIVDEAVELSKTHCGHGAGGFTNGVLRSMLRDDGPFEPWSEFDPDSDPARHLGLRHSLPDWLAQVLIDDHGFDDAMRLAASFNERPPLYFRILDEEPASFPRELNSTGDVPGAFRADNMSRDLKQAVDSGELVVQDLGSQLVGHFCTPHQAERVLDACAGLGGKTLLLADLAEPDTEFVAVDPKRSKLKKLVETANRTRWADAIEVFHGDLADLPDHHGSFDLVLVDAPCSGLGVIRRHPETRWRRTRQDVENRVRLQTQLLDQAASRVADGGLLVYSVCSFTADEGPLRAETFLDDHAEFERELPSADSFVDWPKFTDDRGDLRLNPADHDADAFYAARLRKSH